MDPNNMTLMQWILVGGTLGLVVGFVPLITGFVKKNLKFGILGFLASIIGGLILGLLLAIPIAAVFTWLILRGRREPVEVRVVNETPIDVSLNKTND
jgi:uncharacterized membrane protein